MFYVNIIGFLSTVVARFFTNYYEMTIEINKKFFIYVAVLVVACVGCFFAGRFVRFTKLDSGNKLIQLQEELEEEAQELLADLQRAGLSLEAAQAHTDFFRKTFTTWADNMSNLQDNTQQAANTSKADAELLDKLLDVYNKQASEGLDFIDMMIEKALLYEALLMEYCNEKID